MVVWGVKAWRFENLDVEHDSRAAVNKPKQTRRDCGILRNGYHHQSSIWREFGRSEAAKYSSAVWLRK